MTATLAWALYIVMYLTGGMAILGFMYRSKIYRLNPTEDAIAAFVVWPYILGVIIYHELTRVRYVKKIILGKLLFPDSVTSWCPLLYVLHQDPPGGYLNEQRADHSIGPGWFCIIVNIRHLGVQNMNKVIMQSPVLTFHEAAFKEIEVFGPPKAWGKGWKKEWGKRR